MEIKKNVATNHSNHNNNTPQFIDKQSLTQQPNKYTPIVPVPFDAPAFQNKDAENFNNLFGCEPSDIYEYPQGRIVRWDFIKEGKNHKEIRPFCFCELDNGEKDWRSCGFPSPYQLYNGYTISCNPDAVVMVCEGEKTANAAKNLFPELVTTTSPFGANSAKNADWSILDGRKIIVARDHDAAGKTYGDYIFNQLDGSAQSINLLNNEVFENYQIENGKIIESPRELAKGWDLANALEEGWTADLLVQFDEILNKKELSLFVEYPTPVVTPSEIQPGLCSINMKDFLERAIPPRKMILSPIIPEQGLVMLFAPRGIGKTYVALTIAYIVAAGGKIFDRWGCETPCKILFVDGEMPASVQQARIAEIHKSFALEFDANNFQIITPDLLPEDIGIPDLSTKEGQQFIEKNLDGVKLIILDNLSALCRTGKENESESWASMQEWLLSLRRRGIAVLIIHHANKNGGQRGTSKKEDLLDTVVELRRAANYNPEDGARFEVHYTKSRGFFGDDATPFEAWLTEENGKMHWQANEIEDSQIEKAIALSSAGMTQRDIAKEMGISLSSVNRLLKKGKT